jgi:hypothetical protein
MLKEFSQDALLTVLLGFQQTAFCGLQYYEWSNEWISSQPSDFLCGYPICHHSYDEPLHCCEVVFQSFFHQATYVMVANRVEFLLSSIHSFAFLCHITARAVSHYFCFP